ncbi:TRAP-type C4-dicarboxylate transport system permease small subunit [Variovorax paradoxus]|uniref:TRAP transporter small permease n=1 Tax=Variovorax paradoxus TaxID=34073 RepID=UPI00339B8D62
MGRLFIDRVFKGIEAVLAALLLGMVLMVFGNVVLRYAFNSGIQVSEELSRIFFVWLTFIGAIVAMRDGAHLGMDGFVVRLSRRGKLACLVASQTIVLVCCAMLFWGTWQQHEVNATTKAPVTEISMIWVFGVGYLTSLAIGAHALHALWRIASGRLRDDELVQVMESEEMPHDAAQPGVRP